MIVRNEAPHIIRRCLDSVLPLHNVDSCFVIDTGDAADADNAAVVQQWMGENGLGGEVVKRPWKHFGPSRTEALELARGKCDMVLIIDADEWLVKVSRKTEPDRDPWNDVETIPVGFDPIPERDTGGEVYWALMRLGPNASVYPRVLFVDPNLDWKWKGWMHEGLYHSPGRKPRWGTTLTTVELRTAQDGARSRVPETEKFTKDCAVMESYLDRRRIPRDLFHLAKLYRESEQWQSAVDMYLVRGGMRFGWSAEAYLSNLYAAQILRKHGGVYAKDTIESCLHRAYDIDPSRCEAPFELAEFKLEDADRPATALVWYEVASESPWIAERAGMLRKGERLPYFDDSLTIAPQLTRKKAWSALLSANYEKTVRYLLALCASASSIDVLAAKRMHAIGVSHWPSLEKDVVLPNCAAVSTGASASADSDTSMID